MSLQTELTDLLASAPAAHRDAIDRASAAVARNDGPEAARWIDRIPPGYTSWHERLNDARETLDYGDADNDSDFYEQFGGF